MKNKERNELLESLRNTLIKKLSPNYFYSKTIVSNINAIIDFYKYDKRAIENLTKHNSSSKKDCSSCFHNIDCRDIGKQNPDTCSDYIKIKRSPS